jgi:hypothetical protein
MSLIIDILLTVALLLIRDLSANLSYNFFLQAKAATKRPL